MSTKWMFVRVVDMIGFSAVKKTNRMYSEDAKDSSLTVKRLHRRTLARFWQVAVGA